MVPKEWTPKVMLFPTICNRSATSPTWKDTAVSGDRNSVHSFTNLTSIYWASQALSSVLHIKYWERDGPCSYEPSVYSRQQMNTNHDKDTSRVQLKRVSGKPAWSEVSQDLHEYRILELRPEGWEDTWLQRAWSSSWEDQRQAQPRQRDSLHRENQNWDGFLRWVLRDSISSTHARNLVYVVSS